MGLTPSSQIWDYFTNIVEEGMAECKLCKQRLRNNRSYNLKLHLKTLHSNREVLNNYFNINHLDNVAECKRCNHRLKNRLCNLRLHMRRIHKIEIQLPVDVPSEKRPSPQPNEILQIASVSSMATQNINFQEGECGENKSQQRNLYVKVDKQKLLGGVIGLIVEDGLSPHVFSSKHIESVLRPICEAITEKEGVEFKLDEGEIERILTSIANYIRTEFSNELHWRLLSIKIDTDLIAAPNTFCVSAQFINDGEIQTRVLGLINLEPDILLSEEHIKQILYKFNIDTNQIISAFWDKSKQFYYKPVENSEYQNEINQFAAYPEIYVGDVRVEQYLGITPQICLLDIFKNSKIFLPFLECRNVVKFISEKSHGYYEIFEQNNLTMPKVDSPWKWGSTYRMIHDLYQARDILQNVQFEKIEIFEDKFNVTDELWSFAGAFCISLAYLQKSILKYCSEEIHIGDFYAQWLKCKLLTERLQKADNKKNAFMSMILLNVLEVIEHRTKDLFTQDRFAACIFLDPRFQLTLISEQKAYAVEYLKALWSRAKLYMVDGSEAMETANKLFDDDEDAFLNEFLCQDIQEKDPGTNFVNRKIEDLKLSFQMVDTNVLSYWRSQKLTEPELHALSTICFAIPATDIFNKLRYSHLCQLNGNSKISQFTKENLLYIRLNAIHVGDALLNLQLFSDDPSNTITLSDGDTEFFDNNSRTETTISANSGIVLASSSSILVEY